MNVIAYSPLDVHAFPFDVQRLALVMQQLNFTPKKGQVVFKPSATGTKIFTFGSGDDLSGFRVKELEVQTENRRGPWGGRHGRVRPSYLTPAPAPTPTPARIAWSPISRDDAENRACTRARKKIEND